MDKNQSAAVDAEPTTSTEPKDVPVADQDAPDSDWGNYPPNNPAGLKDLTDINIPGSVGDSLT